MSVQSRAVKASCDQYHLGDAIPLEGIAAVPNGTSVLVVGPSMMGTDRIALDVIEHGLRRDERGVIITPDQPADRVLSQFEDPADPDPSTVQIVDCSSVGDTVETSDDERVKQVSSPGNLTDIGISLTKSTHALGDGATAGVRVALLSVSTLLQYTDVARVFKFVHVVTSRFMAAGYCCVATIDATMHDDDTLNSIKGQFDAAIELREAPDGGREIRAVGFPDVWTGWESL